MHICIRAGNVIRFSTIATALLIADSYGNEAPPEAAAGQPDVSEQQAAQAAKSSALFPDNVVKVGDRIPAVEIGEQFNSPDAFPLRALLLDGAFNEAQPVFHPDDSTVEFPAPGLYLAKNESNEKVILAYGDDALTNADIAFEAVAIFSDGGSSDIAAFSAAPLQSLEALLDDPRDVSWNCGIEAAAMRLLLSSMGVSSRLVQWVGPPSANGQTCDAHQDLEVYLPDYGGWTLYDPHFGIAMKPGFSSLDAFETFNRAGSMSPYIRLYRREAPWHRAPWRFIADYDWAVGVYDDGTSTFTMTPKTGMTLDENAVSPCISRYELQPDRELYRAGKYGAAARGE